MTFDQTYTFKVILMAVKLTSCLILIMANPTRQPLIFQRQMPTLRWSHPLDCSHHFVPILSVSRHCLCLITGPFETPVLNTVEKQTFANFGMVFIGLRMRICGSWVNRTYKIVGLSCAPLQPVTVKICATLTNVLVCFARPALMYARKDHRAES